MTTPTISVIALVPIIGALKYARRGRQLAQSAEVGGYRVMSNAEYKGAVKGKWTDGDLVQGDSDEMGRKWLWSEQSAAVKWQQIWRNVVKFK